MHAELIRWPIITPDHIAAAGRAVAAGTLYGSGQEVQTLEAMWAEFAGLPYVLGLDSCTSALTIALAALGVGPGDDVLTSAFGFVGTLFPILYLGARPILVDCDPATYLLPSENVAAHLTPKTKAVIVVHLHGAVADTDAILSVCHDSGVAVVEDACQAQGAGRLGAPAGTLGAIGCWSLNVAKTVPAGQGGLIGTRDPELMEWIMRLRSYGEAPHSGPEPRPYISQILGYSSQLSEVHAALAKESLRLLPQVLLRATTAYARLATRLIRLEGLTLPQIPLYSTWTAHKVRVRIPSSTARAAVCRALEAAGLPWTRWQTIPLTDQPALKRRLPDGRLAHMHQPAVPETRAALNETIILGDERYPLHAQNDRVIDAYSTALESVLA